MIRILSTLTTRKCSILILNPERQSVMKKTYVVMAVIAAAMLSSCEREKDFNQLTPLGENDIAFVLQNASTRSMEAVSEAVKGISIPVGSTADGESLYLEETIEELNPTLATRGTPAYTVNLGTLYKTMGVYAEDFGDNAFVLTDEAMHSNPNGGDGWRYHHSYDGSPWPDETTPVDFYLNMPASPAGVTITDRSDKQTTFSYSSPLTGAAQQDILFAQTTLTKKQHDGFLPKGAPVMMYHALTGVKFRTGNNNTGATKTIITKVEFTGLAASGTCVFTPSSGKFNWNNLGTKNVTFEQEFSNPDYSRTSDNTIDYGTYDEESSQFGETWYSAAADKNLNDEDGSLTFWFIPQTITEAVSLRVTFCVKTPDTDGEDGGGMITHTIDFGSKLNNVKWEAGQLRTYTLEPREVDVEIYDTMEGNKKEKLHVTNTGNVHEYVRMTFLGNWYDKDGNILVGYKYSGPDDSELPDGADPNEMTLPWYGAGYPCRTPGDASTIDLSLDTDDYDGPRVDPYGSFDPTFTLAVLPNGSKWVRASGGYYYTEAIGPGDNLDPATQALFKSYTLTKTPIIYVPSTTSSARVPAQGVHLVMEVAIQAIYAPMNEDGTEASNWKQEWYNATGNPKLKP